eukprot:5973989-Pyramimonas_sp.AAC.1
MSELRFSCSGPISSFDALSNAADQPTTLQWVDYEMPRDLSAIRMVVPASGPEVFYAMFSPSGFPPVRPSSPTVVNHSSHAYALTSAPPHNGDPTLHQSDAQASVLLCKRRLAAPQRPWPSG